MIVDQVSMTMKKDLKNISLNEERFPATHSSKFSLLYLVSLTVFLYVWMKNYLAGRWMVQSVSDHIRRRDEREEKKKKMRKRGR